MREIELTKHKVLFGCVAETNPKYLTQTLNLLLSLRWFGGELAETDFMVCTVGRLDKDYREELEKAQALIKDVDRFDPRHPPSNKLRFLQQRELYNYDIVVLLDCDTLIVDDPTEHLHLDAFQAKIADDRTVSPETFRKLFKHLGLSSPPKKYYTTITNRATIWYCNSGVLVFPKALLESLVPAWIDYNRWLLTHLDLLGKQKFFCEQASLTLAFYSLEDRISFKELPAAMNFPIYFKETDYPNDIRSINPVILRYHWLLDPSGYIRLSPCPNANRKIASFNQKMRKYRKLNMNNKVFWNFRYSNSPELGSGLGSRGLPLIYKKEVLRKVIEHYKPGSVLDVGCGDSKVTDDINIASYLGLDISQVAIEASQKRFPTRKYVCADFLSVDLRYKSDLTLCLDVVIHIPQKEVYREFVKKLVHSTDHIGIVSGFEEKPKVESEITFYHEPLSVTLKRCGAKNVRRIGKYRDTTIFLFDKAKGSSDTADDNLGKPIFIVGCIGSGTTLLANLLDSLENVAYCPYELKQIWSKIGGVKIASPKTRDLECPTLDENDVTEWQREKIEEAFCDVFTFVKKKKGKLNASTFLSKNPHLSNKLRFLKALFPNSRIIWIHRDLPSVAASLKGIFIHALKQDGTFHYWPSEQKRPRCWGCFFNRRLPAGIDKHRIFPGGDVRFLAEYWLETNLSIREFKDNHPHEIIEVEYENLIFNPEEATTKILAALGEELSLSSDLFTNLAFRNPSNKLVETLTKSESETISSFIRENAGQIRRISSSYLIDKLSNPKVKRSSKTVNKTIVVLGMHRSGTSMIAGVLESLGVDMGKNLMGPRWSNPLGHFENWEFVELNDKILKASGGSWNNPPSKEDISTQGERFLPQIKELIEKEKSEVWGWKDPRTSLTVELYLPYLENPHFIICYRNPLDIAKSLMRRDGTRIEFGLKLTGIYNGRIMSFLEKNPSLKRIYVSYESFVLHPDLWLENLIGFLNLNPEKEQLKKALRLIAVPLPSRTSGNGICLTSYSR